VPDSAPFVVDDVRVVRHTDLGWTCEIGGRTIFVGRLQIVAGSSVPRVGDRGRLTLTRAAARDLGLLDLAASISGPKDPGRRR
jgi:hypothetical protein